MASSTNQISLLDSLHSLRHWRQQAFKENKSVGFVPTMGALHDGHISLGKLRRSLKENDLTVVSIFVNPAQFAPHEDLATYPRTLDADMALLSTVLEEDRGPSAVFLPPVKDMYPSGIVLDVSQQKGTFVEVKGYGHQMEGQSRPGFFRGVATVVTKLFNAVQPSNAYFGQKDIQQAFLLRRMVGDLLMAHPTPSNLHIVPTHRLADGLALSSRNAYLSPAERLVAPTLYHALKVAGDAWNDGQSAAEALRKAFAVVEQSIAKADGIAMKLDYIQLNDPETFEVVPDDAQSTNGRLVILSGALWVGKTRLIDNILLCDGIKAAAALS